MGKVGLGLALILFVVGEFIIPQAKIACVGAKIENDSTVLTLLNTSGRSTDFFELRYILISNKIIDGEKVDTLNTSYHTPKKIAKSFEFNPGPSYDLPIDLRTKNISDHVHLLIYVVTPKRYWFGAADSKAILYLSPERKWIVQQPSHFELEKVFSKTFSLLKNKRFPSNVVINE